jgi:transketolase
MRNTFAAEMTALSVDNPNIVLLSGDIGNRLFDNFKKANAERFLNCGIAEANMMGVASGMALSGMRPVIYTITPFTTTRCLEQIRVDACYHKVPVIIVGTGSGLSYAELGATHHSCEDLAILRVLPEMTVLAPCDVIELQQLLKAAFALDGPVYIRIGKKGEPNIHTESSLPIIIGKASRIREGRDICILATGTIMSEAVQAAELLEQKGISTRIESIHTIKPLDTDCLLDSFSNFPIVATCEEHSQIGGLFGSVAEWRAKQRGQLADIVSFAVPDKFMHEVGDQHYAREKFGLTANNIAAQLSAQFQNYKNSQ